MSPDSQRLGILATHPIQYYAPWYRALAKELDLEVFFSHRQSKEEQASAGYGVVFDWDVPLLDGYRSTFLNNVAKRPSVDNFWGCNTPELPEIIRQRQFDAFIVHGWSTFSFWQAIVACWRSGTPVLVRGDSSLSTPRSWWWCAAKWPAFRAFIPRFDGYLVVGSRARDYLLHYGADRARCFDAPHSVDNQFFASACERLRPDRARLRRDFGLPEDAIVFLFAGRFIDRKRPDLFVEALAAASLQVPCVTGLMVGDGPLRAPVQRMAVEFNAPVRFAGFLNQTEMARAYVAADCLVVPSTWETWSLVVNEAMACGLPALVSSGVACAGDLVVPGLTGEVFPIESVREMADRMATLARDATLRTRLGENAAHHVQRFDIAATVSGTLRAARKLAENRARSSKSGRPARVVLR